MDLHLFTNMFLYLYDKRVTFDPPLSIKLYMYNEINELYTVSIVGLLMTNMSQALKPIDVPVSRLRNIDILNKIF